jgi:hypothetical protein
MNNLTKEQKIAIAKDITCAFVRNESSTPTPEAAAAMLKAMVTTLDELSPEATDRKVGLG